MTRVITGCEPVLVLGMLRHTWDMHPLSVPSHMQSGSSAPAMYLYSKQVCLMQVNSCYRSSGWGKVVCVTSKCRQARYTCKLSQQLKRKLCQMITVCTMATVSQAHSISDCVPIPPNLTRCLYLSHAFTTQYLSRASRVCSKHLTVALSEQKNTEQN